MLPYPKVILFDLDDTLISFEGVSEQAWEKCCSDFTICHEIPYDTAELLECINTTRKWYWSDPERHKRGRSDMLSARREIVALAMKKLNIHDGILSNELADSYSNYREKLIHLFPHTLRALDELKSTGIRLGMITNGTKESQRRKLDRFALAEYFEHILVEGEVGFGKPDEQIYRMALSLFNVSPQDCWMIGDNLIWDVHAPQELGIHAIWYDNRGAGLPQNSSVLPNHVICDVMELLPLITNNR